MLVQANCEEAEARGLPVEDLQIIEQEIRRMERCLQTFLDFARPPQLERRPVSLAVLVQRMFTLVEGRARKQHVTLHFRPPTTPVIVEADADQMQQLLVNLALNALDAMPQGGSLDISLGVPVHGQVELRVHDTGPGIAPALLPRLFEPFVSSKETGLGLGPGRVPAYRREPRRQSVGHQSATRWCLLCPAPTGGAATRSGLSEHHLTPGGFTMPVLLVIDDEPAILHAFRRGFQQADVTVLTAASAAEGLAMVTQHDPDVVLLDLALPDLSGLDVFRRIHQRNPKIPVIFITGHGTTDTAIEAMKLGAFDYLLKPLELAHLRELVARACAISRLMRVPAVTEDEPIQEPADVLVGRCPAMQDVYKAIGRVAPQDVTVLIRGETGTGKELVARAIYHHSRRAAAPFLAVNCAAIPETLLESELFGHERGAFTGAERKRIGKFEQCSGGTLFLDEIGDMTPLTQAKILRVLQAQQFERVGGNETIQTNVRIIAANRDLEHLSAAGRFAVICTTASASFPSSCPRCGSAGMISPC